ncbi:heavy metal-associated domain-containing protein [Afipia sp. 1NLS2]|uniref:heavy-metal-associated domain-containing protein n=1 Tax=Afipia sp. 1NLS2 TaxID=666684 RepID=UPI0001D9F95A|nr:heavy metal-associated domain-containing protein [Afipia sp. 1NLS2]EFI53081.1 Heavy metal transport/detoxification protein [Afipia sp. 1NLS2]
MVELEAKSPGGITLSISGMTCVGCANTVTRVLARVAGVDSATVDFASGRAMVAGGARLEDLIAAVTAAGYGVQPLQGMTAGGQHERS